MAAQHIGLIANLDKPGAVDLLRRLRDELTDAGHHVSARRDAAEAADFPASAAMTNSSTIGL